MSHNCTGEVKGDKLILTVDISEAALKAAAPSSQGKTLIVGGTGGFTGFGKVKASLNVTIPNPEYKKA